MGEIRKSRKRRKTSKRRVTTASTTASPEEIELKDLINKVRTAIESKYGMNVNQFSKSEKCTKLGINGKNLPVYLSPNSTTISFPALKSLCKSLGLGDLNKKVEKVITVTYTL